MASNELRNAENGLEEIEKEINSLFLIPSLEFLNYLHYNTCLFQNHFSK